MAVLVLNATYEPVGVIDWRHAIVLMVSGVVDLIEADSSGRMVRSAGGLELAHPAVVRCRRMVPSARNRPVPWTRTNLRIRDGASARSRSAPTGQLDHHLQPISRGGEAASWTNTALRCAPG